MFKKVLITKHIETGRLELVRVTDIARNEIRNPTPSVSYQVRLVEHGHMGIRLKPFETAGSFWSKSNGANNDDILRHDDTPFLLLFVFALFICYIWSSFQCFYLLRSNFACYLIVVSFYN